MILNRAITVSRREAARVNRVLRAEFASGIIVIVAAALGFALANSPLADPYIALREVRIGPAEWHLDLSLGTWAADGLLAIFFFMVGLELKREFVSGALRRPATAIIPVGAAIGGVLVPAAIFLALTAGTDAAHGWAIPTATDIAFAVTVLGLVAPRIPPMLRVFLLTLAVVDDFIAITIIALFYSSDLQLGWLGLALVPLALYAFLAQRCTAWFVRRRWAPWVILLPLGIVVWALVHASGVHATIAGVLLAFVVPVTARATRKDRGAPNAQATPTAGVAAVDHDPASSSDRIDLAEVFNYRFGPLSSGFAVPIFAFFAAGVPISGGSGFWTDPIALGIILGLVIGKPLGIGLSTWLLTRLTGTTLGDASAREIIGVSCLGGIGFTVALLVADLSLDGAPADTAGLAVMAGSVLSAAAAAAFLLRRPTARRRRADWGNSVSQG